MNILSNKKLERQKEEDDCVKKIENNIIYMYRGSLLEFHQKMEHTSV